MYKIWLIKSFEFLIIGCYVSASAELTALNTLDSGRHASSAVGHFEIFFFFAEVAMCAELVWSHHLSFTYRHAFSCHLVATNN